MSPTYPGPFRARAVQMVLDRLESEDAPSRSRAIKEVASTLGIAAETLRLWVLKAEVVASGKPGDDAQIRCLERENRELRSDNQILKSALGVLCRSERPSLGSVTADNIGRQSE